MNNLNNLNDLRILIIADNPLARAGLSTILGDQPDCTIVGQVSTDGLSQLDVYDPDVVVWDMDQPHEIDYPLAALIDNETQASAIWAAGARGIFSRDIQPETLVAALHLIADGLVVIDPDLAGALFPSQDQPAELDEDLTTRELEVLHLLAEGHSNRAIAHRLDISDHTVKFHVNAIMTKLNAQSRTEAAVRAMLMGLINL